MPSRASPGEGTLESLSQVVLRFTELYTDYDTQLAEHRAKMQRRSLGPDLIIWIRSKDSFRSNYATTIEQ